MAAPLLSCYGGTLSHPAANKADMTQRCRDQLRDVALDRAVLSAAASIPLAIFDENESPVAAKAATRSSSRGGGADAVTGNSPALAALHQTLRDSVPPRKSSATCASVFFSGGSLEGPFPGARSSEGMRMAST